MQYDTIVVGMGAAGVTAASTLAKAGIRVLGLEAQDRIGGRVHTVPFGDGVVELGAEWIHGERPSRVYDLAIANDIPIKSQSLVMEVYRSDGSSADKELVNELIEYCLSITELPTNDLEPLGNFIRRNLTEHLRETRPEVLKDEDFMTEFFELMNLVVDNYEGSDDWNDVSAQTNYQELEGDQHLSWHRFGYKTFFELMLNTYNNGTGLSNLDIKLSTEVVKITWPQLSSGLVQVTCQDGKVYTANNVIVTLSVGVLKERYSTLFSPPLNQEKIMAIDKLTMGVLDKIVLSFPETWLPRNSAYTFLPTKDEKDRLRKENDWMSYFASTPLGSNNTLTLWVQGKTAKMVSIHSRIFIPSLPAEKVNAIDRLNMGVMDKIVFSFSEPWWPTCGAFYAFLWRGADKKRVKKEDYWTTRIFGASCPMGTSNALTLWTSGDVGKLVETLPEDVVRRKSMELLQRFLGANVTVPEPTGMRRTTWFTNPYTRGSYTYDSMTSVKCPNSRSDLAKPLLDSSGIPRVLFAGEATDLIHFSTVHGASKTGYREAMRLLPSSKI